MILYHASDVEGIKTLKPQIANHNEAYVYLSTNKENVSIYLVNPIRKFCLDNNISPEKGNGWYRIGIRFHDIGGPCIIPELWPNEFEEIYAHTPSYFYKVEKNDDCKPLNAKELSALPYYVCSKPIDVKSVEVVPDTLKYLKKLEKQGKVVLEKFEDLTPEHKEKIRKMIIQAYNHAKSKNITYLIKFLENKFDYILNEQTQKL